MFDLDHQNPNSEVAKRYNGQRDDEVNSHHSDGVRHADCLSKSAGINPMIILQRTHKEVWQDGHQGEQPCQAKVAVGVLQIKESVILEAVANITVPVDCYGRDVENGTNDA